MADVSNDKLTAELRERAGRFIRARAHYKGHLLEFFTVLRNLQWRSVIFGGTLRDLMTYGSAQQPRDVDIVVDVPAADTVAQALRSYVTKRNRFGGLHLSVGGWPIDVWPLSSTWAFRVAGFQTPTFDQLPQTTFLNVEAVAVELWPEGKGQARRIYENVFFQALRSKTIDINFEENPFPELCVIRSLITGARLDFSLAPRLSHYVRVHGKALSEKDLERIQVEHYGKVRTLGSVMKSWVDTICTDIDRDAPFRLPVSRPQQLSLWEDWNPAC